jgi:hypothetical protein
MLIGAVNAYNQKQIQLKSVNSAYDAVPAVARAL